MRRPFLVVSVAVLVAALPQVSGAQVPGPQDSLVLAALARLQPGKGIRVHTAGLGRLQGKFASLTDTTVALGTTTGPRSVAVAGIDSLWQRGSAAATGALVGMVIGGVLIGVAGGELCKSFEGGDCTGSFVAGAAIGVAGGALVGGVIGALIPTWKRKVP